MPERNVFRQQRNSLICLEITAMREVCKFRVLACYCQLFSRLLISSHTKTSVSGLADLRNRN
jgi:hypothetical protein